MGKLGEFFFGSKPKLETQEVIDPLKTAVSSPLSSFLGQSVGRGLPRYSGELAPEIDPNYTSRYNEFLGLNANDLFSKYVEGPQTESFKRDFLPVLQEGYAGALRGSGRYRSEEDAINRFSTDLAGLRYKANLEVPQAQFKAAQDYYNMRDLKVQRDYQDWWKSLPENNPALEASLRFLSADSGITTISALNPGTKGIAGDLIKAAAVVGAAMINPAAGVAVGTAVYA